MYFQADKLQVQTPIYRVKIMRASEIIRKIADVLDAQESGKSNTEITNRPEQTSVDTPTPANTQDAESQSEVNVQSMVSPIQQKFELLKKATDIDNAFDNGEIGVEEPGEESDELAILKRNAGVPSVVVTQMAHDDEPFDN